MIELSESWLTELIRATLVLSLSVGVAKFTLHATQAKPATRVVTWILALIPCWLLFSVAVQIPWFEPITDSEITSIIQWDRLEPPSITSAEPANAIESEILHASLAGRIALGLMVIWLSGMVCLIFKYTHSYSRLRSILSRIVNQERCGHPMSECWHKEFEDLKSELAFSPEVELRISEGRGPLVCLFHRRYYVIVPEAFWESGSTEQRSAISLHEICHVKRADVWLTFVARVLMLPQWFNPIAWYALRKFGESVEMACDDEVLEHAESGRFEYAKSLISLVEFKQSDVSFALSAGGPPVRQRIQRIVNPKGIEMKFARMLTIVSLVLISTFGLVRPELVAQKTSPVPISGLDSAGASDASFEAGQLGETVDEDGGKLTTFTYYVGDIVAPQAIDFPNGSIGITERDFEPLKQLIVENVSPNTWGPKGLGTVSAHVPNLSLIVTQTHAAHDEIQEMLKKVHDLYAVTVDLSSFVVLVPNLRQQRHSLARRNSSWNRVFAVGLRIAHRDETEKGLRPCHLVRNMSTECFEFPKYSAVSWDA